MINDITELLSSNAYPGRGIVIGMDEDGMRSVALYFIMGRSENSRNRVFEKTGDGIRTKAFDPARLTDPSLVIYNPVRAYRGRVIVTNGDQTDTILEYLKDGRDIRAALATREFEPDAPLYTPRISGLIERGGSYCLSILKTADGDPSCCCRYLFEYPEAIPGTGHFISTYLSDGNPPPSFSGEPVPVKISLAGGLESFAKAVWESLNFENKVSLYARAMIVAGADDAAAAGGSDAGDASADGAAAAIRTAADEVIFNKNTTVP